MDQKQRARLAILKSVNAQHIKESEWNRNTLLQECFHSLERYQILKGEKEIAQIVKIINTNDAKQMSVPFPVSWTVKMKKKQKETQDILSYHTQAAGCSDKARAKASGGRQPIEECGRTGL